VDINNVYGGIVSGVYGGNFPTVAPIKQWSEARPKQYTPMERFVVSMSSDKRWKRNAVPASANYSSTGSVLAWDFSQIQETESVLCSSGTACLFGDMTDGFTSATADFARKIGDVYLDAVVEFKGLGTPDARTDSTFAMARLKRDFQYFCQNYQIDLKTGDLSEKKIVAPLVDIEDTTLDVLTSDLKRSQPFSDVGDDMPLAKPVLRRTHRRVEVEIDSPRASNRDSPHSFEEIPDFKTVKKSSSVKSSGSDRAK